MAVHGGTLLQIPLKSLKTEKWYLQVAEMLYLFYVPLIDINYLRGSIGHTSDMLGTS